MSTDASVWSLDGYPALTLFGESGLDDTTETISFTGDFGFWTRGPSAQEAAAYLSLEAPLLSRFHHRVLNLEFLLPGLSGRVADRLCEERSLQLIDGLGFDCFSLANNHAQAFGNAGLDHNLAQLETRGRSTIGLRDRPGQIVELGGARVAIWSVTDLLDDPDPTGRVLRCREQDFELLDRLVADADLHIGFPHLGSRSAYPSPRELELSRRLLGLNPVLLVCTGSHFPKGFTQELGAPICFGLGNHLFTWEGGGTEPVGMHLVAGFRDGALVQIFVLPFRNTILSGGAGPLDQEALAAFRENLADRSTVAPARFFADPRTQAGARERMLRLRPRDLGRLRPRHLVWGLRVLWERFRS